ncbi:MAG: flavohemoprotein [Chloroflexi bacterium]|nr:flavohemoprotein [Chloroflexota bacterium]
MKVELLEQSFAKVTPRGDEFVESFYNRLFDMYPEAKAMFAKTDMKIQKKKLLESLVLVVNNLRKPDVLGPALANLGKRHKELGAEQEHYAMVGEALLGTFEEYLEDDWTPELESAWTDAYAAVVAGMTA